MIETVWQSTTTYDYAFISLNIPLYDPVYLGMTLNDCVTMFDFIWKHDSVRPYMTMYKIVWIYKTMRKRETQSNYENF